MRYMFMIYGQERDLEGVPPEVIQQALAEHGAFHEEMARRGIMLTADRLQPSHTATVVRVRDGETLTTDGPFTETKEVLGGVYIFECQDLDEALAIAARHPSARGGAIEVRPIMELPVEEDYIDAEM